MNMFKKNGGFTLVELIVAIAILAILAGIAVPAYSGYLKSAEKAGDITALSAVKTAAFAAMATTGEVTQIDVTIEDVEDEETEEVTKGVVTEIAVTVANDTESPYTVYTTDTEAVLSDAEEAFIEAFELYLADVPNMSYFTDTASWTVADGWAE